MQKYRFIGLNSFSEQDKDRFFEREDITQQIIKQSYFEQITVVHSKAGIGKTSLLEAGLIPEIKQKNNISFFNIKINKYQKKSSNSLLKSITKKIKEKSPKNSFLDRIVRKDDSLWNLFKRIENPENQTFYLILDQFENVFSYPQNEQQILKKELSTLLFEQIPDSHRDEIEENLSKNSEILTKNGLKKLYEKINLKLIIFVRTEQINQLDFFEDKIRNIKDNIIEIPLFNAKQAGLILKKTSSFIPKYNIDNFFSTKPFKISENLLDKLINFLTDNKIKLAESYQLQIIGLELEKKANNANLETIDSPLIDDISIIYKDYYETIIEKIKDSKQKISARKFIEDELIFENEHRKLTIYEGLAKQKYELEDKTIRFLIENQLLITSENDKKEKFFELSHSALITPILLAKEKRIHQEIRIEEELSKKKELEEKAKIQKTKIIKNRKIAILFSILFVIALGLGIMTFIEKNTAKKNEKIAKSTIFASYSFQNLETNPTLSFRLAEHSYNIYNENIIVQKAFFASFYKTQIFYQNLAKIKTNYQKAFISPDASKIILISESKVYIIDKFGKEISSLDKKRDILSVQFSPDSKSFAISRNDSTAFFYDIQGNQINKIKQNSLIKHISIAPNNSSFVTCCSDNNLYLWNYKGGIRKIFKNHTDEVIFADYSKNGEYIVSTGLDNNIIVWDTTGKVIKKHEYFLEYEYQNSFIEFAGFAPDSNYVFFVMNDFWLHNYVIKIWDWKNDKILNKINYFSADINSVYFIDNKELLISSADKNIYLTNYETNKTRKIIGHSNNVLDARYDAQNQTVYSISVDKTIKSWKIFTQTTIFDKYLLPEIITFSNKSTNYAVFADSKFEILSSIGTVIFSTEPKHRIKSICYSEEDKYIATTSNLFVNILNKKGEKFSKIKSNSEIFFTKITEKNNRIAIATDKKISIYNLDGVLKKNISFDFLTAIDINFERKRIIYSDGKKVKIVDFNNSEIKELNIGGINKIKFTKHKESIFIASNDTIYLLNEKFKITNKISTPNALKSNISDLGNLIFWYDNDNNCRLVNLKGEELYNFEQTDYIFDVQISPNETILLIKTIDNQGNIKIQSKFISINEILNYINIVKIFGDVDKPNINELELIDFH